MHINMELILGGERLAMYIFALYPPVILKYLVSYFPIFRRSICSIFNVFN